MNQFICPKARRKHPLKGECERQKRPSNTLGLLFSWVLSVVLFQCSFSYLPVLLQFGNPRGFIDHHNQNPKPFVWTQSADQILDSVARFRKRTLDSVH